MVLDIGGAGVADLDEHVSKNDRARAHRVGPVRVVVGGSRDDARNDPSLDFCLRQVVAELPDGLPLANPDDEGVVGLIEAKGEESALLEVVREGAGGCPETRDEASGPAVREPGPAMLGPGLEEPRRGLQRHDALARTQREDPTAKE